MRTPVFNFNPPDNAGGYPLLHSQNMEERRLLAVLPVIFIIVKHYLLQRELCKRTIFSRRRFSAVSFILCG